MTMIQSAKDFRAEMKENQFLASQLLLLNNIGLHIAIDGFSADCANKILEEICRFATLEHGMIIMDTAGVYKVKVSRGAGLLSGSRIASSVSSHIVFLPHETILMNATSQHKLWTKSPDMIQSEWLIPIRLAGQTLGFIALASDTFTPMLNNSQIKTVQTAAAIIGLYLRPNTQTPATQDMQAIALLTPREKEVFSLIPLGLSNAEIGAKLGISAGTAKIHVERILSKLGLSDRTQAAVKATKMGYTS